jgi:hypothetical protein
VQRFPAASFTTYEVEVVLHPSNQSLQRALNGRGEDCWAFCDVHELPDNLAARLHFFTRTISLPLVAHEVFHAVSSLRRKLKLVVVQKRYGAESERAYGEELEASAAENITKKVLRFCRASGVPMKADV